jgi:hypothetical protein
VSIIPVTFCLRAVADQGLALTPRKPGSDCALRKFGWTGESGHPGTRAFPCIGTGQLQEEVFQTGLGLIYLRDGEIVLGKQRGDRLRV